MPNHFNHDFSLRIRGRLCAHSKRSLWSLVVLFQGILGLFTGNLAVAQTGTSTSYPERVAFVDRAVDGFFKEEYANTNRRDFGFMSEAPSWSQRLESPRVAWEMPQAPQARNRSFINSPRSQDWLVDRNVSRTAAQEQGQNDGDGSSDPLQPLGEAPEDQSETFLRREAVLMKRGSWEIDWGLYYAQSEDSRPILVQTDSGAATIDLTTIRRSLIAPFSLRYGATDRIQILATVPVGWSNSEVSFSGFDDFDNIVGVGDITCGLSGLVRKGKGGRPDLIVSFATTAPAANPDIPVLSTLASTAALGTGHWGFSTRALFIQKVDPVVIFYGFGYRQLLAEDFFSETLGRRTLIEPGAEGNFQFGVGFAASNKVNLNASVQGAYVANTLRDGIAVEGTARQQTTLRFSSTIRNPDQVVEPFIQFNANGIVTTVVGITWTYAHKREQGNE